ncbi:MAG: TIGR02556 family CRISPR-associated protein [Caldisericia bacterium]
MLEAIRNLGEGVINKEKKPLIYNLVYEDIQLENFEEPLILILNFNLDKNVIELDRKEIDSKILNDYLWVGNALGNNPQDRLTTNNIEYFMSQTIYNLYKNLPNFRLKENIKEILDKFYIHEENFLDKKEVYLLDISKIQNINVNYYEIVKEITQKVKDFKNFLKEYSSIFFEKIKPLFASFKKRDILLYSIEIDGKKPNEFEDYISYLETKILNEPFQEDSFIGKCHVCGKETDLTSDTANLVDKYYIQKLIIFASNLDKKNFSKNFSMCKDCYKYLIVGSKVLRNYLNFYFAGKTMYLIPSFIFPIKNISSAYDFVDPFKIDFDSILNIDGFFEFEKRVQDIIENYRNYEDNKNYININLLFYERDQASFKIQKLIKDIPSRRRDEIFNALKRINNLGDRIFGEEERRWILTLNQMYYFFPVRLDKKNRSTDYKKVLDFYESLFLGKNINLEFLIKNFVEMIKVYKFERFYKLSQIKRPKNIDIEMIYSILKSNLLIKMLKYLNILNGGKSMIEKLENFNLNEEIKNYFKEMDYSEEEAALFLLGYLIGEIGNQQRTSTSEKKPILEKINYHGMSPKRLMILVNDVFEKLDQYRIRQYNETNFSVMKLLFDKNIKNWKLSDIDNVYYILSGYAFNTYKIISSKKSKEVSNE